MSLGYGPKLQHAACHLLANALPNDIQIRHAPSTWELLQLKDISVRKDD